MKLNIRCIEMFCTKMENVEILKMNLNIRCIEIVFPSVFFQVYLSMNLNIRCIEIHQILDSRVLFLDEP